MALRAPILPWEAELGAEPRQWGESGRITLVRREYALYDDVLVDGIPIGMVWLQAGTAWRCAAWGAGDSRVARPSEASSFDDAVQRLVRQVAPELVPDPPS